MDRPQVMIVDALTNESIVREMNDDEYAAYLASSEAAPTIDEVVVPTE